MLQRKIFAVIYELFVEDRNISNR